jgi:hypothetical protein
MRFPNLVIGGAPKCGTTSLFTWLADHPDICGSRVKEPFFLMDRHHPLRRKACNVHDHGIEAYADVFRGCTDEQILMEASTHYIYQATALDVLETLPTEPRIVFLLRKPSERVFSSFAYSKNNGNVRSDLSFPEFVRFVRADPEPSDAAEWASAASAYVLPRDLHYSRYVEYLSEWRERLGDGRIRVMIFETMRADPKAAVQGLCGWLGIDPSFYDNYDFEARNRTVPVRSRKLQKFARTIAGKVPSGPLKDAVTRAYYALQSKPRNEPRTEADEAVIAELDEYFRPYNERLAREFGLNLESWK